MKVLIELPTWLGDAVMTTPAIENLLKQFSNAKITLIGSFVSIEALKNHPKINETYVLDKKIVNLFNLIKNFEEFDIFLSFRSSYRSKIIKFFVKSKEKYQFNKFLFNEGHQVERYNNFVNSCLSISSIPGKLTIHNNKCIINKKNKLLGINPGASYGSAKQWYPKEFAKVAIKLSCDFDILILGGSSETAITKDIENYLVKNNITNYKNLAGKTSLDELMNYISNLDILITGDSGPMHLAAAFQVPTVAIFGPTKDNETSQWMNKKSFIVKKNLDCQPCMKRTCPLKHHNCMRLIDSSNVLKALEKLYV